MTAALLRALVSDDGEDMQMDLPLTPVEFLHWTNEDGRMFGVIELRCAAFAEPYLMRELADRIEVLG